MRLFHLSTCWSSQFIVQACRHARAVHVAGAWRGPHDHDNPVASRELALSVYRLQ